MTDHHRLTPPSELLKQWEDDWFEEREHADVLLIQAYQAGADAELDACCDALDGINPDKYWSQRLRAALAQPEPQGPKSIYRYSPVTIAECGGPCEQGPEYCDCGEIKGEPEPQGPTGRPDIEPVPVAERLPGPQQGE
jgi:hypothetical protein